MKKLISAIAALALLTACEAKIGKDDSEAAKTGRTGEVAADAKAGDGQFSIDAPGFALKFDIPAGLAERATVDSDGGVVYPGASISGLHIQANKRGDADSERATVELNFTSKDRMETVIAWYRDPARARDVAISSFAAEGDGFVIKGTRKDGGDPFTVRLTPASGGGTNGQANIVDRG